MMTEYEFSADNDVPGPAAVLKHIEEPSNADLGIVFSLATISAGVGGIGTFFAHHFDAPDTVDELNAGLCNAAIPVGCFFYAWLRSRGTDPEAQAAYAFLSHAAETESAAEDKTSEPTALKASDTGLQAKHHARSADRDTKTAYILLPDTAAAEGTAEHETVDPAGLKKGNADLQAYYEILKQHPNKSSFKTGGITGEDKEQAREIFDFIKGNLPDAYKPKKKSACMEYTNNIAFFVEVLMETGALVGNAKYGHLSREVTLGTMVGTNAAGLVNSGYHFFNGCKEPDPEPKSRHYLKSAFACVSTVVASGMSYSAAAAGIFGSVVAASGVGRAIYDLYTEKANAQGYYTSRVTDAAPEGLGREMV